MRHPLTLAALLAVATAGPAWSQADTAAEIDACRASGLIALKERSPAVKDLVMEADTVSVSKADTTVGDTKVRTVVLGLADIQTGKKDKPHQFVCLIGDKGKVLLTFFTDK